MRAHKASAQGAISVILTISLLGLTQLLSSSKPNTWASPHLITFQVSPCLLLWRFPYVTEEQRSRFDISECAGQTLLNFEKKLLDKEVDVQVALPEHPVYVMANRDYITQVVVPVK